MILSDNEFREAFKPLYVPSEYPVNGTDQDKVVFALARLNGAPADDVIGYLSLLDKKSDKEWLRIISSSVLITLFDKGLISGDEVAGKMVYNLNKTTRPHNDATHFEQQ